MNDIDSGSNICHQNCNMTMEQYSHAGRRETLVIISVARILIVIYGPASAP